MSAISLLDKYAQINQNIEEARRHITSAQSAIESTNLNIETLRNDRIVMEDETTAAREETTSFEKELKQAKLDCEKQTKEIVRMKMEYQLAKREVNDVKRQIDEERLAFLDRCREFRSSCKRMKAAATILVLEDGGVCDEGDWFDVWRRLQEDDLDSSEEENEEHGGSVNLKRFGKRKKSKSDIVLERVVEEEKRLREGFIEAECALHAARSEHGDAVQRCEARNQKLTQQRAQLERHRREVDELNKEIEQVNNEIDKANQDVKSYENVWKRGHTPTNNGSYNNHFNPPPADNFHTPLHNSNSFGNSSGSVSNPYKSQLFNPYRNQSTNNTQCNTFHHQYATNVLRNAAKTGSSSQQTQNKKWGSVKNQRQFGTAIDVSTDYTLCTSPKFSSDNKCSNRVSLDTTVTPAGNDDSSVSSASSDDDVISFDIFGKGK